MNPVHVFAQNLSSYGADRARAHYNAGLVDTVYAYIGPDNASAQSNRQELATFRAKFPGLIYGWWVATGDHEHDVEEITRLDERYDLDGWKLNLEAPLHHVPLRELVQGTVALGKPVSASVAGADAATANYDYRALDLAAVEVDWQAYFDSGEGPTPERAIRELVRCSFVVGGWEYRHRLGDRYGWAKCVASGSPRSTFDSYLVPKTPNAYALTSSRPFGANVTGDRRLYHATNERPVGVLVGRAAYGRTRFTLDVTRGADAEHTPDEWRMIASSGRLPNARPRPVSVYLAENVSDETLAGIAAGAGPA